jgi:hypothetical protein
MAYGYTKMPTPSRIKFDFDLPGWEVLADQVLGPCCSFSKKRNKNGFKNKLLQQNTVDLAKYKSFILNAEKCTTFTAASKSRMEQLLTGCQTPLKSSDDFMQTYRGTGNVETVKEALNLSDDIEFRMPNIRPNSAQISKRSLIELIKLPTQQKQTSFNLFGFESIIYTPTSKANTTKIRPTQTFHIARKSLNELIYK